MEKKLVEDTPLCDCYGSRREGRVATSAKGVEVAISNHTVSLLPRKRILSRSNFDWTHKAAVSCVLVWVLRLWTREPQLFIPNSMYGMSFFGDYSVY